MRKRYRMKVIENQCLVNELILDNLIILWHILFVL